MIPQHNLVLDARHLSVVLDGAQVLRDVSLEVPKGTFTGLVGPNGGGKTTLLRTIVGLVPPSEGTVRVSGHAPRSRAARATYAFVPQNAAHVDSRFPATAREIVSLGRAGIGWPGRPFNAKDRSAIDDALRESGIWELRARPIGRLSGGQRQRVFLAKALAKQPELLILDEPTTGVDDEARANFYGILRHLNQDHEITVLMASHEVSHLRLLADAIVVIDQCPRFRGTPKEYEAFEGAAHLHSVRHHAGGGPHGI